jgi:membrane fusion protein, multidrug efflux system
MLDASPRFNTSQKTAALIVAGLLVYLVGANIFSSDEAQDEPAVAASSEKDLSQLVKVEAMQAQPHPLHITLNGATEANRQVRLKAQVEGQVQDILKTEGADVKEGDVIMRVDVRDRKAQLAQSEALLEQRRVEYAAAQKLNKEGFYSDVRLAQSKAEFESAKAQLSTAKEAYDSTFIRAPFSGVLEQLSVEVGDLVGRGFASNGDDSVATVVEYDPIVIVGQVPQQRRADIVQDAAATVTLFGNRNYEGRIRYIGTVTNPDTRTFRVEVEVQNADREIPVGVSAEMQLPAGEAMAYDVAPSVLSQDDEGKVGVKTVDDNGTVSFHHVTLLEDSGNGFWIGGLPESIRLVTTGQNFVSAGQRIDGTSPTANEDAE